MQNKVCTEKQKNAYIEIQSNTYVENAEPETWNNAWTWKTVYVLKLYVFSRFYTYFIIQYGPDVAE